MQSTPTEQGTPAAPLPTPYRDHALTYRAAGWIGVLPVPYGTKKIAATGWTGHAGRWPSGADIQAWCDNPSPAEGGGNIALRLPVDVIGLDIDAYTGKNGATTLAGHIDRWGSLPATWTSTSRDDGTSGIRLYRVPEGLRWPGQAGPHIEIIQTAHRYAVVWPSVHPDTGSRYRWIRPDGIVSTEPPDPDQLPELPDTWIIGLTGGELAEHVTSADLAPTAVRNWINAHHQPGMCRATSRTLGHLVAELGQGSAHEALRRLHGLARLAEQGHHGLVDALHQARAAFIAEVTSPRRGAVRTVEDADGEFMRSLTGAVRKVVGMPSVGPDEHPADPCEDPFGDIVDAADITAAPATLSAPATRTLTVLPGPSPGPQHTPAGPAWAPESSPAAEPARSSWWPVDLAAALSGDNPEKPPTVLARSDNQCLFYAGKVNGLLGESESGKTWVALHAVAQQLAVGHPVAYLDFEDSVHGVVGRLTDLGVDRAAILDHLTYINPDEAWSAQAVTDLGDTLAQAERTLIVLDGVNAAMALLGMETNSNDDATRFAQLLLNKLAATGAAVIVIDHVAKNKETRGKGGIGAQAKRAMIRGCSISVEVIQPFGRGMVGQLKLLVDKDRPGYVRGFSAFAKQAGTAILMSDAATGQVQVRIEPADQPDSNGRTAFRPTGIMERISRHLASLGDELSGNDIEKAISGRAEHIRAALAALVEGSYVERREGPRRAALYRHRHVFRELDELTDGGSDDD